ncbi:MAG: hypothetical protein R6V05_13225 [Candidatus Brocadiia bacterium]
MSFLKRNKFWFALGLLVVVAGVTFGAVFLPSRGQSEKLTRDVKSKAQTVTGYQTKSEGVSEEWISHVKKQQELWREELQEVDQWLSERYQWLDRHFEDPDNPGQDRLLASEMWRMVYADKLEEMQALLKENFPDTSSSLLPLNTYGPSQALSRNQMLRDETKYWILQAIIETLGPLHKGTEEPVIHSLGEISFLPQPERLVHPSHEAVFQPVAFQLRLTTRFPQVPQVLHTLLSGRPGFHVTSFTLGRASGEGVQTRPTAAPAATGSAGGAAPASSGRGGPSIPTGGPPTGGSRSGGRSRGPGMPDFVQDLIKEQIRQAQREGMLQQGGQQAKPAPKEKKPKKQDQEQEEPGRDLPENLVDVTIRGYVTDYVGPQRKGD